MLSGFTTKLLGAYLFDEVLANRICGNTCYVFELQSVMARCINLKGADPRIWGPDGFRVWFMVRGRGVVSHGAVLRCKSNFVTYAALGVKVLF